MRVQIAFDADAVRPPLEIPWASGDPAKQYLDLREAPKALDQLELAQRHRPLRTFLAEVNGGDSVFATVRCGTWPVVVEAGTATREFASCVELVFAEQGHNRDRALWEDVAVRVEQLLGRETADESLRAELRLHPCRFRATNAAGFTLAVFLYARGGSIEQAELRWGLGLARIQQALLFTSRALRQQGN
jgi:hypothetical protein